MADIRMIPVVDLTAGESYVEEFDAAGTLGLGGKVLGVRLLEKHLDLEADPLSRANVIVITPSLLAAYNMHGSNRFGAFTRSPLTGIWLECYCGGTFARTLTETRWDGLIIKGAADAPVHVHVTAEGAEIRPASDLWGKDTLATEDEVLSRLDGRSAVLCIGVGGENLVKIASVMHERAHSLGRGGLGAVFGSKRLKALSVSSSGPLRSSAEDHFAEQRRAVGNYAKESPATRNYILYGTPVMVRIVNDAGAFPTDFFEEGEVPHRATLEAEHWPEWARIESDSCPPCQLRCRKRLIVIDGPHKGLEIHGAEYETLYTFGGSCMVEHALNVARLNERCNLLGMDSISAGNLAAIAIKARQAGRLAEGPKPGDTEALLDILEQIATRSTAAGDTLADGMDRALAAFGMSDRTITSKGLDPAGYEPRRLKGMALAYALSPRGACHLRATFYKAELGGLLKDLDDETYVATYIDWENRMLLMDSFTMCRFYRDLLFWEFYESAAAQLKGEPVTEKELESLCDETLARIRKLNLAFGMTPSADTIAERFFTESTDKAPPVDRAELERRVRLYWIKRGWTETGIPNGARQPAAGR
jgi:aldehyde:ferredoxin oxidoreductase